MHPGTGPTLTGQVSANMDGRSKHRQQDLADPAGPAQPEPLSPPHLPDLPDLPLHPTIIRSAVTAKGKRPAKSS